MNTKSLTERIEAALHAGRDFESFAQGLLRDCLNWPIDPSARSPDEISYGWSGDELRFDRMGETLTAREILLVDKQPYGIFLLEFKDKKVFDTRGFTTPLRKALRGLVASRRKDPNLRSWAHDKILFICTHDYQQYVFAQFWDPFSTGKVGDARLATFGWSPGIPCRTAIQINLPCLVWPEDAAGWNDWRKAFDKEPLTQSFFKQFDAALELIKADLEKLDKLPSAEAYSKAQLLLERLIFLYFVQNRGWLEQQPNLLYARFKPYELKTDDCNYYSEFLEKLFWSLSIPPGPGTITHRFEGVPFLNGGLFDDDEFDPTPQGRKRNPSLSIRNSTFARVFDDLLEAFNFTVREDTPLNQEVAVDPEMLGKVFESIVLHAESADPDATAPDKRKQTGSYYTARIVVHFNCREVLYQYLLPRMTATFANVPWQSRLRRLLELDASDGLDSEEQTVLRDCLTPTQASFLLELLKKLRCCDPAVGSGAFMVGLLHELTNLRRLAQTAANGYVDPLRQQGSKWLQETKADIIQNCLFGVDIQQQAIEICMLRLWLSLVVDYDLGVDPFNADRKSFLAALRDISQLPNLEMNFKRGDSLHDHICGVPVVILPGKEHRYQKDFDTIQSLGAKLHNAKSSEYKRKLRLQILERRLEVSARVLDDELKSARRDDSLLTGLFGPSQSDAEKRKRLVHEMEQLEEARKRIERSRKDLTVLAAKPLDARFRSRLRKLEGVDFDSPFNFAWRIDFPQVFHPPEPVATMNGRFAFVNDVKGQMAFPADQVDQGGFDIMVGNPPFVTARNPVRRELWRERWQPYCRGTYQLLVPFFPLSFGLLRPGGELGFIVSNAFAKREFGKPLVELFFPSVTLQKIVDCSGLMFPGHGTPTLLIFGSSDKPRADTAIRVAAILPGGGDLRTPPEDSGLWRVLSQYHDVRGYADARIAVDDWSRTQLARWPLNLIASSEETRSSIERSAGERFCEFSAGIGRVFATSADDAFFLSPDAARRGQVPRERLLPLAEGDEIRNWSYAGTRVAVTPYSADWNLLSLKELTPLTPWLGPFRKMLGGRASFSGGTYVEAGIPWYSWHQLDASKLRTSDLIAFTEIATHGHFVVPGSRSLFTQTSPVIKLNSLGGKATKFGAAAFLNSCSALFLLKQVCFCKRESEQPEKDTYYVFAGGKVEQLPVPERIASALKGEANPLATTLSELAQACSERGQVLPSLAMKKLFEKAGEAYHKWNLSLPGYVKPHETIDGPFESEKELRQAYKRTVIERERLRSDMIALQEEMDWLVYAAYGLLTDDSPAVGFAGKSGTVHNGTVPDFPEPLDKDLRPYRMWQKAEDKFDAAIALIPADWTTERKALWQARLQAIRDNEHIRRIEQPVYKRRWDEQWKVKNRWECGEIAYRTELRDAFDWWLREKAEWRLEHKAKDQQATLHDWAKALWKDERIRAAVEVVVPSAAKLDGELPVPELVPQGFERLLKEVVDEETVLVDTPFAKPWEELEEKKVAGWKKARQIRGKLNVPRERFHLISKSAYSWAGKLFE